MPLFFFHLTTKRGKTRDPLGVEFASLADAIADAKLTRIEYLRGDAISGRRQCRIEITDATGDVLAVVPHEVQ
jgi:uncharacterized protein DUF6894